MTPDISETVKHVTKDKCQLYRHFDKDDILLYVGISLSTVNRLSQHREVSPWFDQITRVTIEHYQSRQEALAMERQAIKNEKPKFNLRNNKEVKDIFDSERIRQSRIYSLQKIVNFEFLYSVDEAAAALNVGRMQVVRLIDDGKLSFVEFQKPGSNPKTGLPFAPKKMITGWSIIDFVESSLKRLGNEP